MQKELKEVNNKIDRLEDKMKYRFENNSTDLNKVKIQVAKLD
jgi:hypothetical protein